jgi:hypothetical protein
MNSPMCLLCAETEALPYMHIENNLKTINGKNTYMKCMEFVC